MPQLAYVLSLAVCGIFVVGGLIFLVRTAVWVSAATWKAEATVVDMVEKRTVEGTVFYPVFRFEALGREWKVVDSLGRRGIGCARTGERVTVYYPPHAPEKARIGRERHLLLPAFIVVLGLLMGILILLFGPPGS